MAEDPFDRLGAAVAGVLRGAFETAEATRESAAADAEAMRARIKARMFEAMNEALDASTRATRAADAATADIEAARAQAVARAEEVATTAGGELLRVRQLLNVERERFAHEVDELLADLRETLAHIDREMRYDQHALIERASTEARGLLRQARMHHRSVAKEVDRMIEAAATEAAALRAAALEDAAAVTERVRAVVDLGERDAPQQRGRRAG